MHRMLTCNLHEQKMKPRVEVEDEVSPDRKSFAADIIKFSLQICINISNILGAVVYVLFLENNEARDLHCCARLKRDYMPFFEH